MTATTQTTAAQLTTAQQQIAQAGENHSRALAELDKEMAKLGGESVNVARPKLAITLVNAAAAGDVDEDDVEARYDAYLRGREKAQAKSALAQGVEDGNGKKANVSKCRQLVKMAMLPGIDGPALIDATVAARTHLIATETVVEAPFDAFVKVAREQVKSPDAPLTEEQIFDAVRKPERAEKSELDKLIDAYKRTHKLQTELPGNEAMKRAVADLAEAITEEGGDVPPMTKEEKAEAEAMAYIAKRGLVVVPALTDQREAS